MTRLERFNRCLKGPWTTGGLDVQWRWKDRVLTFQCTRSEQDWKFNFMAFTAMVGGDRVHAGFASLWLSVVHDIDEAVGDAEGFVIEGYSLGGALTQIACRHFRDRAVSAVVFGSPKVFGSKVTIDNLEDIQVHGDLFTLLPPWFHNAGTRIRLGKKPLLPSPLLHAPEAYRNALS